MIQRRVPHCTHPLPECGGTPAHHDGAMAGVHPTRAGGHKTMFPEELNVEKMKVSQVGGLFSLNQDGGGTGHEAVGICCEG
jgi:hypothetical protein